MYEIGDVTRLPEWTLMCIFQFELGVRWGVLISFIAVLSGEVGRSNCWRGIPVFVAIDDAGTHSYDATAQEQQEQQEQAGTTTNHV